jgi:hypothetical protein
VRAVEARELFDRPSCSNCSPVIRSKRGCFRPGHEELEGAGKEALQAWRFTSPLLSEAEQVLLECPVGLVLRETPDVYRAIEVQSFAEQGGVDPFAQSPWMQDAIRIVSSERARCMGQKDEERRQQSHAKGDAEYARNAVRRRKR